MQISKYRETPEPAFKWIGDTEHWRILHLVLRDSVSFYFSQKLSHQTKSIKQPCQFLAIATEITVLSCLETVDSIPCGA